MVRSYNTVRTFIRLKIFAPSVLNVTAVSLLLEHPFPSHLGAVLMLSVLCVFVYPEGYLYTEV